jgi:hypothetical protein
LTISDIDGRISMLKRLRPAPQVDVNFAEMMMACDEPEMSVAQSGDTLSMELEEHVVACGEVTYGE